jgi:hypothetical protein
MPGPINMATMNSSGQCVAAIHSMVSRVGAYVRSRMANHTFNASIGIARRSSAPLDSIAGHPGVYYQYAYGVMPSVVAIIIGSR